MRGLYSSKTKIRQQIFTEVARFAYEGGDYSKFESLPYKIIPGEISTYRESVFLERAIVGERLRLAMGLNLLSADEQAPISTGVEESMIDEKVYEPPLINIIKFACHSCPEKRVFVSNGCQGCLEHPCTEVRTVFSFRLARKALSQSCTANLLLTKKNALNAASAKVRALTMQL